jgi:hypothetical protein
VEIAFHRILTEIYHVVSKKNVAAAGGEGAAPADVKRGEALVITAEGTAPQRKSQCCK